MHINPRVSHQKYADGGPGLTVSDVLEMGRVTLKSAGMETPALDSSLLLRHVMHLSQEDLLMFPKRPIEVEKFSELQDLIKCRSAGVPVSRIIGHREFWSLPFLLTPAVLDPRPDSESLVETSLQVVSDLNSVNCIADLGTGTGCLLLALLSEFQSAVGIGVDISAAAITVAQENARILNLSARSHFVVGDWGSPFSASFDLIVANPPYISDSLLCTLADEVKHDPELALAGGLDGLDAFKSLAPHLARLLTRNGTAVVEVGEGQALAVRQLLEAEGLKISGSGYDLAGHERCIIANREEKFRVKQKKGLE